MTLDIGDRGTVKITRGVNGAKRIETDYYGCGTCVEYQIPKEHYFYKNYGVTEAIATACNGGGYMFELKGDIFNDSKFHFRSLPSKKEPVYPLRPLMNFLQTLHKYRKTELTDQMKELIEIGRHIVK